MEMRLNSLSIENFKGIKKAMFTFGDVTRFYGKNASGKTSIADAFSWLLYNKDSKGNAPGSDKFREKPLDSSGHEVHYLDTTVEANCTLDGHPFNLKRAQRENWVTRRGSANATYQGNSSTYWINDVEVKSSEFSERINGIANGELFHLLTTLGAFNALDWKKKRSILLSLTNIDVDHELIGRDAYRPIADEAASVGVSIDDLRKVLSDRRKAINSELTLIPARIDEATRMLPSFTDEEIEKAERTVQETSDAINSLNASIVQIEAGNSSSGSVALLIMETKQELAKAKSQITSEHEAKERRLLGDLDDANKRRLSTEMSKTRTEKLLADMVMRVTEAGNQLEKARKEYSAVYAEKFVAPEVPSVCPTCGQDISDECWKAVLSKKQQEFFDGRAARIKAVQEDGQKKRATYDLLVSSKESLEAELKEATDEHTEAMQQYEIALKAIEAHPASPDMSTPEIIELESKVNNLMKQRELSPDMKIMDIKKQIAELQKVMDEARDVLGKRARREETMARIEELKGQQTSLGQKKASIENMIYLIESFIVDRCKLLEESVNEKFPSLRWKLFDTQINGAIVDCCECQIYNGESLVAYDGTNTAASVNADIEIIGVLSEHYDVTAPVFVDNAERVNAIAIPKGQLVTLSVTTDDELKVEINNREVA